MTDRPKIDGALVKAFRHKLSTILDMEWTTGDDISTAQAICDLALVALDNREVRAKALRDAADKLRKLADGHELGLASRVREAYATWLENEAAAIWRGE